MGGLSDLAARLEAKAASLPKQAAALAVVVAQTIADDLIQVTPVDTSQAISNWQVTLDNPATSFVPPHVPGHRGSTYEESVAIALALAERALEAKAPSQPIYIVNNAPYIVELNEGKSGQQPAGFVERTILVGRILITRANLEKQQVT